MFCARTTNEDDDVFDIAVMSVLVIHSAIALVISPENPGPPLL
jgi:hypothetical protein